MKTIFVEGPIASQKKKDQILLQAEIPAVKRPLESLEPFQQEQKTRKTERNRSERMKPQRVGTQKRE
jgi:hypothetical protein